jgi:hypothetical protein
MLLCSSGVVGSRYRRGVIVEEMLLEEAVGDLAAEEVVQVVGFCRAIGFRASRRDRRGFERGGRKQER